jgi:hypothetical protein
VRLNTQAQTQIQNILSNLYGAVDYIKQAQQSRADVFRYKTPTSSTSAGPIPAFSQVSSVYPPKLTLFSF